MDTTYARWILHLTGKYQLCGKRSQERPRQRLLDCEWDQNRSRGIKPCGLCDYYYYYYYYYYYKYRVVQYICNTAIFVTVLTYIQI